MLHISDTLAQVTLIIVLPICGGVLAEVLRIAGNQFLENTNPGIYVLRNNWQTIDFAMKVADPELRDRIHSNPVAIFAREILSLEVPNIDQAQANEAIRWMATKFDYNHFERFDPSVMDPIQQAICDALIQRVRERTGV